ncbi:MAG: hypothetical protein E7399_03255 [Ruminococcaceae bacterium]|nr:hypothetical protein [Oscillospiraceae bacterium]
MRILHCADLHLNRAFAGMTDPVKGAEAKAEQVDVFSKIIALAKDVDVLLIAGDFFDSNYFELSLLSLIREKFASISHVKVFISPGNHDPYTPDSPYALFDFGDNVHIFRGETEKVDCGSFAVWGNCGVSVGQVELNPDQINLLCIHGDLGGNSDYNPLTRAELEPFTYCALGHVHSFSGLEHHYAYSGVPLGGGFDETGQKGVIMGEIGALSFVPIEARQYHVLTILLDNQNGYEGIEEKLFELCPNPGKDCWSVRLTGTLHPEFPFQTEVLKERIGHRFYYLKLTSECSPYLSYEEMADEYTLRGLFVREMLERLYQNPDDEVLRKALELGVSILDHKPIQE